MQLKAYQVLSGIIGTFSEKTDSPVVHLSDRVRLYKCVYELLNKRPDIIFDFDFRCRSGRLVSPDIDLCIRNMEDTGRLSCRNPELVDFERTKMMKDEFAQEVRPLLEELGVLELFTETSVRYLAS